MPSLTFFAAAVFSLALLMNLVRKNTTLVTFYLVQSVVVALSLISLAYSAHEMGLFYAALLTLAVKAVMAPAYLWQMIRKYSAHFSAASYLNAPQSMICLAAATFFAYYFVAPRLALFSSLSSIPLLFATIFCTLFLMINRRGALAAVVGILALENGVVLLSAFLGIEHSLALEFAISFDIAVWVAIAAGFLTMMHRQFGVVDAATLEMTRLTEE